MKKMEIFKDNNEWNEKSVVGFIAFAIMCVIMIVDLITGWLGRLLRNNRWMIQFCYSCTDCYSKE